MSAPASAASALTLQSTLTLNDGQKYPLFGLGTWRSDVGLVETAVYESLMFGVRSIDCAWIYLNQDEVGAGIARALSTGKVKREEIYITTKVWNHQHNDVEASVRDSLKALKLEYIDLLLIHWPTSWTFPVNRDLSEPNWCVDTVTKVRAMDTEATPKSIWQQMERMVQLGLVRSIGVSNFNEQEIEQILSFATIKPSVNQVECHVYFPQTELRNFLHKHGIALTAYCPLGNLKRPGEEDNTPLNDPVTLALSEQYKKSPAQILLRWGIQSGMMIIPKTTTVSRIAENASIYDFNLSADDMSKLDGLGAKNLRFVNPPFRANDGKVFPL